MHKNFKNKKAFSLIELVITISLFSFLLLLTAPIAISQLQGSDTEAVARQIINAVFDAQQSAYSRKNRNSSNQRDQCYGISFANITTRKLTAFNADWDGATCGTRTNVDSPITGNSVISSPISEVYFTPGSFKPNTTGSIDITYETRKYTIYINDEGQIYYKRIL